MFCRKCGVELAENAAVCTNCGVSRGAASDYCPHCGSPTVAEAVICVKCGCSVKDNGANSFSDGVKSKLIAGLLAIFLGHLGLHEFYLGDKKRGKMKIFATVGSALLCFVGIGVIGFLGVWIWNIFDAVKIFTGKRTDADGNLLV